MKLVKDEMLSIRTSEEGKKLLTLAAEHEHHSILSLTEGLIPNYARLHQLALERQIQQAISVERR